MARNVTRVGAGAKPVAQPNPAKTEAEQSADAANAANAAGGNPATGEAGHKASPRTPDAGAVDRKPATSAPAIEGIDGANQAKKPMSLADMGVKPGQTPTYAQCLAMEKANNALAAEQADATVEAVRDMLGRNPVRPPVVVAPTK